MKQKFRLIQRKVIYSGRVVHLEKLRFETPDHKKIDRELIKHRGAAVIVPVLDDGRLVLVDQHRTATNGWTLEFPAGTLEPNESPRSCAYREIIEEIGYRAGKLVKLVDFYPAPGISTERMHLYLATQLTPAPGQLDEDEFIRVKKMTLKELEAKMRGGKIKDGKTIIGFFYYLQYKKRKK